MGRMRLRQGKGTSSLDYAFGRAPSAQALLMLGFAFGGRAELRLRRSAFGGDMRFRRKDAPTRNDFGDVQDVKEKPNRARSFAATPSAEAERTKETAEDVSSPRAPSTIRERRTASAENGGIKIERTRVGVRATAEREFERAKWAVTPPRRHRIQASCGQPKCRIGKQEVREGREKKCARTCKKFDGPVHPIADGSAESAADWSVRIPARADCDEARFPPMWMKLGMSGDGTRVVAGEESTFARISTTSGAMAGQRLGAGVGKSQQNVTVASSHSRTIQKLCNRPKQKASRLVLPASSADTGRAADRRNSPSSEEDASARASERTADLPAPKARTPSEEARRPSGQGRHHAAPTSVSTTDRCFASEQVPFDDSTLGPEPSAQKKSGEEPSAQRTSGQTLSAQAELEKLATDEGRKEETRVPSAVADRVGEADLPEAKSPTALDVLAGSVAAIAVAEATRPNSRESPRISLAIEILDSEDEEDE
ncbi:hypothetical protein AXG93_620s1050 [Marchantia polymorpha subsp. ruderalis]|uniref:Uncharacterized protein n=1 Tax=Marchantia polymorpha subsp. ruderalis TaxID=1480154 RepID=A0A176VQQ0_MARPO|nr:hypothetical protein AXG93_620s1050 [Marchantia polymorpha subsp. ruderalis]